MSLFEKEFNFNSTTLVNIIFGFFPISLILGALFTNINVLLLCLFGIFILKGKILSTKFSFILKVAFLFFLIILFSTALSLVKSLYFDGYQYENLARLIKSLSFFRFFLILLVVVLLKQFNILNFKYFFVSAAICSSVVSLDVIYQYIFGHDILGITSYGHFNSGFFGDELIAGGYIQKFSFFTIFFITYIFQNKNNIRFGLSSVIICFLGAGILFSGNRMPLILFLFGLFLTFFFSNKLRKIIPVSIILFAVFFKFISSSDKAINAMYSSYYGNGKHAVTVVFEYLKNMTQKKSNKSETTQKVKVQIVDDDFYSFWQPIERIGSEHGMLFMTALDTWRVNVIFGNGIKSFRVDCIELRDHKENRLCSNHPHNYYLEILTETGIVGFIFVTISVLIFFVFILKNLRFFRENNIENFILLSAVISLILEMFPFRSTGSLFTTNNATYLILILSIILSHKKRLYAENSR